MSSQDVLDKMKAERDEKAKTKRESRPPEDYYVKLLVSKQRRRQLVVGLLVASGFIIAIVYNNVLYDRSWVVIGLPITFIGLMICLIPPTEEWEYQPWQTQARQYERHQIER